MVWICWLAESLSPSQLNLNWIRYIYVVLYHNFKSIFDNGPISGLTESWGSELKSLLCPWKYISAHAVISIIWRPLCNGLLYNYTALIVHCIFVHMYYLPLNIINCFLYLFCVIYKEVNIHNYLITLKKKKSQCSISTGMILRWKRMQLEV